MGNIGFSNEVSIGCTKSVNQSIFLFQVLSNIHFIATFYLNGHYV